MKDLEILCRGSAFLIPSVSKEFSHKYHVVTSSHVVAPWRWPQYYSSDWLQMINENHIHYTVEVRDDDGTFIVQKDCRPQGYHHPSRDLALLHLEIDTKPSQFHPEAGLLIETGLQPLSLYKERDGQSVPPVGSSLSFHGHEMISPPFMLGGERERGKGEEEEDNRKPEPRVVSGRLGTRSKHQVFATTSTSLTDGMCGGCVLSEERETAGEVVGVVEGIVPLDYPLEAVRGMAVFVESPVISEFITEIEEDSDIGKASLLAPSTPVWTVVGADQDPEKMDWNRLSRE